MAEVYRRFRKFYFLHQQPILMMEATGSSEAVVHFCWATGFISQKTAVFVISESQLRARYSRVI
jgi:hypothetical protein